MAEDITALFEGAIQHLDLEPENLLHKYEAHRIVVATQDRVFARLTQLKKDIDEWYFKTTGKKFDKFDLGDMEIATQERYWNDPRFRQSLDDLQLDFSHHQSIALPWSIENTGGETGFQLHELVGADAEKKSVKQGVITLGPVNFYTVQYGRAGIPIETKSISLAGIPITLEGEVVLTERGGLSYRNTFHAFAGGLQINDAVKANEISVYRMFLNKEFRPESGIKEDSIIKEQVQLLARLEDRVLDRGTIYLFSVPLNLTSDQVKQKWEENKHHDKKESRNLIFLPYDRIEEFIVKNYVGAVANRKDRGEHERYLLHPAALILASVIGMPTEELQKLYKPGDH